LLKPDRDVYGPTPEYCQHRRDLLAVAPKPGGSREEVGRRTHALELSDCAADKPSLLRSGHTEATPTIAHPFFAVDGDGRIHVG